MLQLPEQNGLTALLPHQQIPHLFPGDTQAQNGAQIVPVGEAAARRAGDVHRGEGTVRIQPPVLGRHPIREKDAQLSLRVPEAAPEEVCRVAGSGDEPLRRGLLCQGEKLRVSGDVSGAAQLQLVQRPGKEKALLGVCGELSQQFGLVHGVIPL